eukprot:m.40251 g.40251  ORF g.40251 m.40251 type:complete len:488 (+) comp10414_c0_seq1:124-1587(+)
MLRYSMYQAAWFDSLSLHLRPPDLLPVRCMYTAISTAVMWRACMLITLALAAFAMGTETQCTFELMEGLVLSESDDQRCGAIERFTTCMAEFPDSVAQAEATAAKYSVGLICNGSALPPVAEDILVSAPKVQRQRRSTTTLGDIASQVQELQALLANAATADDLMAISASVKDAATKDAVDNVVNAGLNAQTVGYNAALEGIAASIKNRVAGVESFLASEAASPSDLHTARLELMVLLSKWSANTTAEIAARRKDYDEFVVDLKQRVEELASVLSGTVEEATAAVDELNQVQGERLEQVYGVTQDSKIDLDMSLNTTGELNKDHATQLDAVVDIYEAAQEAGNNVRLFGKVFSGYCNHHGRYGGWLPYCADITEFSNLDEHFTIEDPSGEARFRIKKAGWYRVNLFAISYCSGYSHIQFRVNGNTILYGHEYSQNNWSDNFMDITWKLDAGQYFQMYMYSNSGSYYNWHSGNSNGAHSKIQVEYLGA